MSISEKLAQKKAMAQKLVASWLVASTMFIGLGLNATYADLSTPANVLTWSLYATANQVWTDVFGFWVDLTFSHIMFYINFLKQPAVLWVVVLLSILWFWYFYIRKRAKV